MIIPQSELSAGKTLRAIMVNAHYKHVECLFEKIEKKRNSLEELVKRAEIVNAVMTACFPSPAQAATIDVRQYADYPGDIHIIVKNLTSWKQLEVFFEGVAAYYPLEKWTSEDDADSYTRTYTHGNIWETMLVVAASLIGDTDECKKIIKGWTEIETIPPKPIYAFDCAGEGQDKSVVVTVENGAITSVDDIPF